MNKKYTYVLEVESDLYGAHASCAINSLLRSSEFREVSFRNSHDGRPGGMFNDSIEDCYKRADSMSSAGQHSGVLCDNKDLRRVILLSHYARALEDEIAKMKELNAN